MTDDAGPPILEIDGPRATIRFNRPQQLNKLTYDDLETLMRHFDRVENDPALRVMILTGAGRAFSAGLDMSILGKRAEAGGKAERSGPGFEAVANRLEDLGVPTIARINGGVYGGAIDLALCCDIRIGVDTTELMMQQARLGIHYYRTGIERFVSRLGMTSAKVLLLAARKIDAAEMYRIGYLSVVTSADRLDREVDEFANAIAENAPMAMRGMKQTINEFARGRLDLEAADARHRASSGGPEMKEGVAAFREKRKPRF